MSAIPVRRPNFELEGAMSIDWLGGEALRSQFFNSLSMIFPVGERYLVDSLRRVAEEISDSELRQNLRGFIGQEVMHRQVHADFNDQLERLGLHNIVEPFIEWRIRQSGWLSPLDHIAIAVGVEHFTSLFGKAALDDRSLLAGGHPELQALWTWHAIEEVEHSAIPLAVYRALGGGYARRLTWFCHVSMTLFLDIAVQTSSNLYRSGSLFRMSTWLRGFSFLLGRGGPVRVALAGLPKYLRPGYVPRLPVANAIVQAWLSENVRRFD